MWENKNVPLADMVSRGKKEYKSPPVYLSQQGVLFIITYYALIYDIYLTLPTLPYSIQHNIIVFPDSPSSSSPLLTTP